MGRLWTDGARAKVITAGLVSVAASIAGCAARDAEPEAQPRQPVADRGGLATASDSAKVQACYAKAKLQAPDLSVHTVALFFAREGKLVFVDVELPESPALARCLSDAILSSNVFEAPIAQEAGAVASGAFRIDLGPPLANPPPRPTLAELRARHLRATMAALQQGALRENDAIVRETLNPPAPWPSREKRAELEACHEEALKLHPGLVLHREVIYLTRAGKILLADVRMPEAPELQRCLLDRIIKWPSPLSGGSEGAMLSSFFIDLGAPEELPEPPSSLTAELARRRALVQRALELGLIEPDDPLLERFKGDGPAPPP